jgi:acyl carrier protein
MYKFVMDSNVVLRRDIKNLMVENLMLRVTGNEIGDDQPLFGSASLGLDSVDALQLVVALDKKYGLKILNPERAREVLQNVKTISEAVAAHLATSSSERPPPAGFPRG